MAQNMVGPHLQDLRSMLIAKMCGYIDRQMHTATLSLQ